MNLRNLFFLFILLFVYASNISAQANTSHQKSTEIELISKSNSATILRLKAGAFTLSYHQLKGEQAVALNMEGSVPVLKAGAPEVRSISKSIIIPDLAKMQIKVISSSFTDYQNINLLPSKGNLLRTINPATVPLVKGPEYLQNKFYPEHIAKLQTPYILRDYRGQPITFYPFQYNPITKVLRVYSEINVKISVAQGVGINPFYRPITHIKSDEDFQKIYQRQFINYSSPKYTALSETGSMLIIAHQPYMAAMQPFVAWKNRIGRPTEMVSVQSIGNNSDSIKNFISNYYATHGLTYVLLVGDAQYVTPKMLTSSTASDNWYGYLTGNDTYPEVFIGRFSAESVADVETQVLRTINYEMNPNPNSTYFSKSIGIASSQGPGDDNEYDYQHIRNMHIDLLGYNYQSCSELFDGSQGGNDAAGNPTSAMVANELNNGRGLLLYTGHGSTNGFSTSGFNKSQVALLNNTGKLPFIFAVACVNGNFVGTTCFAESWLRSKTSSNQPVGAIATLMSTINQSWNPPMDGQDEMVDILTESYSSNIKRTFAGIAMNGCMHMNDQYASGGPSMSETWTCFGDPSVMVRTAVPTTMTVIHQPTLNLGDTSLQISVNDSNAYIVLTIHDSIIATSYVNQSTANLQFSPLTTLDTILVVVTAYNRIPYTGNILVASSAQPFVAPNFIEINDSIGNNNQRIDYGETVKLNVSMKNMGSANGYGISAIISSMDTNITIIDSTANYGNLLASDSLIMHNAFTISVSDDLPDQYLSNFHMVTMDSMGHSWTTPFSIVVHAPDLNIIGYQFVETSGNGNGIPDAGESFSLKIQVKNAGHSTIQNVINTLSTTSTYISLQQNSINTPTIEFDSIKELVFNLNIATVTPLGERVLFLFKTKSGVYKDNMNINTRVGIVEEDYETGDFTNFNWILSGDKNWVVDTSEYYQGNNSARSGLVPGDNNMESTMQLPIKVQTTDSLSFYVKVSSEDGSSNGQFWDFLEFKIDNMIFGKWQGELDWTRRAYAITSGTHLLTWTYAKDQIQSGGSDCAWVDYIVFPPLVDDTKIDNATANISLNLYPNPTHDYMNISISNNQVLPSTIKIYNASGTYLKILSASIQETKGQSTYTFSTKDLPSGVYYVAFQSSDYKIVRKFIKL